MSRPRFEGWPAQAVRVNVAELVDYCDRNGYAFPISADASALVETVTDRAEP